MTTEKDAPNEPEVKAQGFEGWLKRQDFDGPIPDTMSDFLDCLEECWQAAFLAGQKLEQVNTRHWQRQAEAKTKLLDEALGQKSIRGQVKLPDAVFEGFVCCPTGKMKQNTITTMELETFILSNCETAYPYRCEFYKLPESGSCGE